jgi:hypothetical protein
MDGGRIVGINGFSGMSGVTSVTPFDRIVAVKAGRKNVLAIISVLRINIPIIRYGEPWTITNWQHTFSLLNFWARLPLVTHYKYPTLTAEYQAWLATNPEDTSYTAFYDFWASKEGGTLLISPGGASDLIAVVYAEYISDQIPEVTFTPSPIDPEYYDTVSVWEQWPHAGNVSANGCFLFFPKPETCLNSQLQLKTVHLTANTTWGTGEGSCVIVENEPFDIGFNTRKYAAYTTDGILLN